MRPKLPLLLCLAFISCTAADRGSDAKAQPVPSEADILGLECGRLAVAVMPSVDREIAESFSTQLATSLGCDHLGLLDTISAATSEATKRSAEKLLMCSVVEYVPYDPSRLVVRAELLDMDLAGFSAADLVRLEHAPCATDAPDRESGGRWSKTISVDAASKRMLEEFLNNGLTVPRASTQDLLEAEILLRDPARFLPFAARQVAEAVRASLLHP